ncbi:hypothetical protein WK68_11665 [Burkholderia ubonensis]|uniref:4Fe-4S binding protein n=1 Tax=Burkholderia ubonensis TaxID=101571 RepID=UPI00075DE44B|nr:4Fe-4S binding protein [Burkholderia ubonensis]KVU41792.1 hypothetical protein WK68_11665 [Burkholderia ubonensis]
MNAAASSRTVSGSPPRLATSFASIPLASPLIVGSGPSTTSVGDIVAAERAGAGAVITKSIGGHAETPFELEDRRRYYALRGNSTYLKSTYLKEILSFERGTRLIEQAKAACSIPVIASVFQPGVDDGDFAAWRRLVDGAVGAGADAVQLDFFYINLKKLSDVRIGEVMSFIRELSTGAPVPVIPKLNLGMDDDLVSAICRMPDLAGLIFIDSLNVYPYIDIHDRGRPLFDGVLFNETTGRSHGVLTGEPLLPFTLGMLQKLRAHTHVPLCAGGGLWRRDDVVRCLMLGARSVHLTTLPMLRGFDALRKLNESLLAFLDDEGYATLQELVDLSVDAAAIDRPVRVRPRPFVDVRARLIEDRCIHCDKCESLTVCDSFKSVPYNFADHCDGCSLCVSVCPTKALVLEQA